jgi:nucleotide-binding universal stress UspA family protein
VTVDHVNGRPGEVLTRVARDAVDKRTAEGSARKVLLEASHGADLLVVGARRRPGHFGLQLGLVAHTVLHHAACPVAVVPQRV